MLTSEILLVKMPGKVEAYEAKHDLRCFLLDVSEVPELESLATTLVYVDGYLSTRVYIYMKLINLPAGNVRIDYQWVYCYATLRRP